MCEKIFYERRKVLTNSNKIKKHSIFTFIILVVFVAVSGCGMSYTSKELSESSTSNSWDIEFKSFDGDLAHSFTEEDDKPSKVLVNSNVKSGSLVLQIQLKDKIEQIPKGNQEIDLTGWGDGSFIFRVVGDNAVDGDVEFNWE